MIDEIKNKLEKHLKRECSVEELINAQKDPNIILSVVLDEIDNINKRLSLIEKIK